MTTWLHEVDALQSLAEGPPGEVRDWANTRLALRAPALALHLPSGGWDAGLALAAGVRIDAIPSDGAALDAVGWAGRLPEDPAPWVEALRPRALAGDEPELIHLLADLGALDADLLGVLSRSERRDARNLGPGLVLRWAEAEGRALVPLAVQIAESVARLDPTMSDVVELCAVLGLPRMMVVSEDAADAVRVGAARAGASIEPPPVAKGSARRRSSRMVRDVLDGNPTAAAAWLRAVAEIDGFPGDWVCAQAGWLAAYRPGADPVEAVTHRAGGEDRRALAAARRAVAGADRARIEDAMSEPELGMPPAAVLAAELVGRRDPGAALLGDLLGSRLEPARLQLALIGIAANPEPALSWLTQRAVGLMLARYLPTEEVLGALLVAVTDDPVLMAQKGWALAEMGDPAAFEVLRAMVANDPSDPELARAGAHGALLLGR